MFLLKPNNSGQAHTDPKENQQTNKTIKQTRVWQQHHNPHNLKLARGNYIRKAEQHYSENQTPSSQQPVHLMMAGWVETSSEYNEEKKTSEY
jgi:hypothetical protein